MNQKRRRKKLTLVLALLVIFLAVSVWIFLYSMNQMNGHLLYAFGVTVSDFASHLSTVINLSDQDVAELKAMNYEESMDSEHNKSLIDEFLYKGYTMDVKFAYLLCPLEEDEIRYNVTEDNASFFGAPAGTPLDVIWLLNYIKDEEASEMVKNGTSLHDIMRYSYLRDELKTIVENRKASFIVSDDEWGSGLSGLAPVYTKEGNFVGMIGVDLYLDEYNRIKNEMFQNMIIAYVAVVGTLSALFFFVYRKYLYIRDFQLYRDPLTSAYNRRYFAEVFQNSLDLKKNKNKFLVLVMFDIDFFKTVNDTYGHDKGDFCLKAITQAIFQVLGTPPNVLVRYGGEEFLVAITVEAHSEAENLVNQVLEKIRALDMFGDGTKVTVSAGGAVIPYEDLEKTNMEFLVKAADDNLYFCKRNGRDCSKITDYTVPNIG